MKYDLTKHKFAVIQDGFTLFGVGETRQAALEDAAKWLEINGRQGGGNAGDVEKMLADPNNHFYGDLILTSDPEKIERYVNNN